MEDKFLSESNFFDDKRRHKREKHDGIITYSMSTYSSVYPSDYKMIMMEGRAIDISYGGLGMVTNFQIEPGKVLLFNDMEGRDIGIVKSSYMVSPDSYRVGVAFS
ncbi:MAG: hypothetical protein HQL08_06915 [Nitrospirae bacterium]|nr:hypothetical protein [Nitrospirota bacterium]